ncbi:MAG TPA: GIY-YIG nuclease family protein [Niabella sp.]|nr:GIY-YIG nuclease family protein [Niabella sp.]
MYYTYVIKIVTRHYYYKDHCADLQKRISERNAGKTSSIRKYIPFVPVHVEEFETRAEAVAQEKYFKTGAGRCYQKSKIVCF